MLLEHLAPVSLAYSNALDKVDDQLRGRDANPRVGEEVSHAYASMKLWLLLCSQDENGMWTKRESRKTATQLQVWNEMWPPFERLILTSLTNESEAWAVSAHALRK